MKKTKFLALLLAAFALTFTFASCGDDDEPKPGNGTEQNDKENPKVIAELKFLDQTAKFTYVQANDMNEISIRFAQEGKDDEQAKYSDLLIYIYGKKFENGHIPTGTYPLLSGKLEESETPCVTITGTVNRYYMEDGSTRGYEFWAGGVDFSSRDCVLKVERSGDTYTLTIDPMKVQYNDNAVGYEPVLETTTKFIFTGKIDIYQGE